MASELISVRDLRVSFGSDAGLAQVLDGVDFSIAPGEIKGLVGESGCGKTTLARAILGILPRNSARIGSGEILFEGRNLLALPEETLVCCGHEYTESNARFALTVEPENAALRARAEEARAQRAAGRPTVPTTIGQERAANPFLRAGDVARLAAIRSAKDSFR